MVFQRVKSGVLVLADMSRRVCNSSSERTGAGKMRFFACDARVVENCLVAFFMGDARSSLAAKETDFMVSDLVRASYSEFSIKVQCIQARGWCLRVCAVVAGTGLGASMRLVSRSNDVGLER